jgi:hypothetical protein
MMLSRSIVSVACAAGLALATLPASASTPAPVPATPGPLAYYIMQGTFIISPAYPDANSCIKALQKFQKDPQPGKDMVVCAHRRP